MKVMVLADVADAEHKDKMVIAKFLAVSTGFLFLRRPKLTFSGHLCYLPFDDIDCHWWPESL